MDRAVGAHASVATITWGVAPCCYKSGLWPFPLNSTNMIQTKGKVDPMSRSAPTARFIPAWDNVPGFRPCARARAESPYHPPALSPAIQRDWPARPAVTRGRWMDFNIRTGDSINQTALDDWDGGIKNKRFAFFGCGDQVAFDIRTSDGRILTLSLTKRLKFEIALPFLSMRSLQTPRFCGKSASRRRFPPFCLQFNHLQIKDSVKMHPPAMLG